jgi:hypothetical protein
VGGVVGGVGAIVLVGLAYLLVRRRRRRRPTTTKDDHDQGEAKTISRHELESPDPKCREFGSPVQEQPSKEKPVVEMESPVPELPAEDVAARNGGARSIRRKPVAKLP